MKVKMDPNEERQRAQCRIAFWGMFTVLFTIPSVIMIIASVQSIRASNRYAHTYCALMEFNTTTEPPFAIWAFQDFDNKLHHFISVADSEPASVVDCLFDPNSPSDHFLEDNRVVENVWNAVIILTFMVVEIIAVVILARECFKGFKYGLCGRLRFRSLKHLGHSSAALAV
jgi:hypothetical protein